MLPGRTTAVAAVAVAVLLADGGAVAAIVHHRAHHVAPTPAPVAVQTPGPFDLTAQVVLGSSYGGRRSDWTATTGSGCTGAGAFAGIATGIGVRVLDRVGGRVLGTGRLAAGRVVLAGTSPVCAFPFVVVRLPRETSYAVVVAGLEAVTRPQADLTGGELEIDAAAG